MNKKLIAILFLMAPLAIFAQKFGHLNSADIIQAMPEYKKAQTELQELEKHCTNELQMMESELAKKSDALAQASQEKMNALTEKITKAIKEVGVAGGYLYIFDLASGIPYISETLSTDVTGAVKIKLGIQ